MVNSFHGFPGAEVAVLAFLLTSLVVLSSITLTRAPSSLTNFKSVKWMRLVVFLLLLHSLLFIFVMTLYLYGVGTSSPSTCASSYFAIAFTFGTVKGWLHLFLTERVHLVYQSDRPRHRSWAYWAFGGLVVAGGALLVCCLVYRRWELTEDGVCYIGYSPVLSYAIVAALLISEGGATILFLVPIYRSSFVNARALAKKSSWSAAACVLTSLGNYLYVPLSGSKVRTWIYATTLSVDVVFNAILLFFLTFPSSSSERQSVPHVSMSAPGGTMSLHVALSGTSANRDPKPSDEEHYSFTGQDNGGQRRGSYTSYMLEVPRDASEAPTPPSSDSLVTSCRAD